MAEDDDYSQDSEAYRKWRSGEDNDRYASSKTPTETGAKVVLILFLKSKTMNIRFLMKIIILEVVLG